MSVISPVTFSLFSDLIVRDGVCLSSAYNRPGEYSCLLRYTPGFVIPPGVEFQPF